MYIKGINKALTAEDVPAGSYNSVNGVILANIGGEILALPHVDRTIKLIEESGLACDERISVPHLNNADVWGTEQEREQNPNFRKWLETHSKFNN